MIQRHWKYNKSTNLYQPQEGDFLVPTIIPYHNHSIKRIICVREKEESNYSGLVLCGRYILGSWQWDMKRFSHPLFVSDTVVSEDGVHKRYSMNPVNKAIESAMSSYWAQQDVA